MDQQAVVVAVIGAHSLCAFCPEETNQPILVQVVWYGNMKWSEIGSRTQERLYVLVVLCA
jgi:hypothetical protein